MTFREWLEFGRTAGYLDKLISVEETEPATVERGPEQGYMAIVERRLTVRIGNTIFGNTKNWPCDYLWRSAWSEVERGIGRWLRGEPEPSEDR